MLKNRVTQVSGYHIISLLEVALEGLAVQPWLDVCRLIHDRLKSKYQ